MLADRIRTKVESHPFMLPDGKEIRKTCSIGYSLFPFDPSTPELLAWDQVLGLADTALYRAKASGRNRAIGVYPGEKPWSGEGAALLTAAESDLQGSAQSGLVRIMGELP